jgi:HD-GYP domain-containing protein (c-di-GMP phosphodiesterase class II)
VRDADAAMYSAKSLGRNQTYVFAEPDEDSRVPRAPISAEGRASAVEIGKAARAAAVELLHSIVEPLPHYRGKPSELIAVVATAMARHMGLPEAEVERVRTASLLHDLGKVAVPSAILDKPGPLSNAEWQSVVQHPRIGQLILEQAGSMRDAVPIILHHHERFSGHGYPYGLRGSDIPLGARIVAVADAYDAMMNDRPYKSAIGHARAIEELRRHAGTQFDPELVTLFCDLFATGVPGFGDDRPTLLPSVVRRPRRSRRSDIAAG